MQWPPSVFSVAEFNQPERELFSYFQTRILVVTKLKRAVSVWSAQRNLVTESETIEWSRKFETSISTVTQYRPPRFLLESTFAGRRIIFVIFDATSTAPRGWCEEVRGILRVEENPQPAPRFVCVAALHPQKNRLRWCKKCRFC